MWLRVFFAAKKKKKKSKAVEAPVAAISEDGEKGTGSVDGKGKSLSVFAEVYIDLSIQLKKINVKSVGDYMRSNHRIGLTLYISHFPSIGDVSDNPYLVPLNKKIRNLKKKLLKAKALEDTGKVC